MSSREFILLREIIHERTGVFYELNQLDVVRDKLTPLILNQGMMSFIDYYYLLKFDSQYSDEWDHVFDAISVQETYFGRELDHINTLIQTIIPKFAKDQDLHTLKIWSAACASGEEPLTIVIALKESGWFDKIPIEIYASDFSPKAILKAQAGLYGKHSFRNWSDALIHKYFVEKDRKYQVIDTVHDCIHWRLANLNIKDNINQMSGMHIIFCRNVFIYFSEYAIRNTVRSFYECMEVPGYLFTGVSESIQKYTDDFDLQKIGGAFVYVKQ
jgi:chemotaxis protein methyltransferase CheR